MRLPGRKEGMQQRQRRSLLGIDILLRGSFRMEANWSLSPFISLNSGDREIGEEG